MFTNIFPRKYLLTITIGFIISALVLGLWMYSQAANVEIAACATKTGNLYLIGNGFFRKECKKNDIYTTLGNLDRYSRVNLAGLRWGAV